MRFRHFATTVGVAVALTLLSSVVPGTRVEVQDWDCPPVPATCARPVAAAGFPVPYISDFHGISPVGSADLVGAVLGMDFFRTGAFLADVAFYGVVFASAWSLWQRHRRRDVRRAEGHA